MSEPNEDWREGFNRLEAGRVRFRRDLELSLRGQQADWLRQRERWPEAADRIDEVVAAIDALIESWGRAEMPETKSVEAQLKIDELENHP